MGIEMKGRFLLVFCCISIALAQACAKAEVADKGAAAEPQNVDNALEAPVLAALVKEGKLPPVEDRLPVKSDIMIEPVYEELGKYGGDLKLLSKGIKDKWTMEKWTEEALFRFTVDGSGVEPNVAKGYDVNEDATEYTIYLREGMKWSDGQPFTSDDVIFYWEDMLKKESFGKGIKNCFYSVSAETGDRALAEIAKIDDYTFKVTHKYPSVLFLERLMIDQKYLYAPAHFYKTIMPEFIGEEAAKAKAEEFGYNDLKSFSQWLQYYYWLWKEVPTLRSFVPVNRIEDNPYILKRNPYYFKTDAAGKQLPYIDRLVCSKISDDSHSLLEGIAGNVDIRDYPFPNFTLLKENEEAGDYRVYQWNRTLWASSTLQLNQAAKDERLREVFQDIRFREALSISADRDEISEIITSGLAAPQQASVPEGLVNYQEGWAEQWTEQDLARANELLDEMGLPYDSDGKYRTFKDGSEFTLLIYTITEKGGGALEQLLADYFAQIGIDTIIKPISDSYYQELLLAGEVDAVCVDIDVLAVYLRPDNLVPLRTVVPWYGQYGTYTSTDGRKGMEPQGDIAQLLTIWQKVVSSTNKADVLKYSDEIIKLHRKNQWILGFAGTFPQVVLVKNNLRNVPDGYIFTDEFRGLGHGKVQQFFFEG